MGVDITLVIEYADITDNPQYDINSLTFYEFSEIHLGRNSKFFSILAGVRGDSEQVVETRGLPKNCSSLVKSLALFKAFEELPLNVPDLSSSSSNSYVVVDRFNRLEVCKKFWNNKEEGPTVFNEAEALYYKEGYYSHSWALLNELIEVYAKVMKSNVYDDQTLENIRPYGSSAILDMMRNLEKEDSVITRAVFWFDN